MTKNTAIGICSTCNFAATCAYAKNSKKPIWFCEMFDNTSTPEKKVKPRNKKLSSPELNNNLSKYKGLCSNCEYHETCKLAHTAGGIWHCAEYQ